MTLKYAGPKALISYSGIDFEQSKEDKYIYLNVVAQLIKAIDHEYIPEKTYVYHTDSKRLSDDEIIDILKKYDPDILKRAEAQTQETYDEIKESIVRAKHNKILSHENIEVLVKNIELMKEYQLQRSFNKSIYYSAINILADILKRDHIDYVIAPMFAKFAHVFHSIQGVFSNRKFPIDSRLEIYSEHGKLMVKLDVITL
jgi:transcriptional regulator NrdR family protein